MEIAMQVEWTISRLVADIASVVLQFPLCSLVEQLATINPDPGSGRGRSD